MSRGPLAGVVPEESDESDGGSGVREAGLGTTRDRPPGRDF